jgi:N-acetylmuramoyl-L-alanine amidase
MKYCRVKLPIFSVLNNNGLVSKLFALLFFIFTIIYSPYTFSQQIKTVVIDAGHGGKDPGCHGNFASEKEVCLSMALKLGALIKEKFPEIKIIYTREKDVFIELIERANIANAAKADLFICIHANAASEAAYGTETYVLGLHRTEAQQKVAERENSIIALEDDKGAKYNEIDLSTDAIIIRQLQLKVFLDHSIMFAEKLQAEFKKFGRYDRGVKQAGFLVLYKTTMPSVLIETGFLTNPNEEKFLGNMSGQKNMAELMFLAFEKYRNQIEGKNITVVKEETSNSDDSTSEIIAEKDSNTIIFRVQIESSEKQITSSAKIFQDLNIFEYKHDSFYKYCTGVFPNDIEGAKNLKKTLVEKGYNNAFVVAFLGGERISIEKAINLAKNIKK